MKKTFFPNQGIIQALLQTLIWKKSLLHQYLLAVYKMNDTVNFKDNFFYILSGYQTRIFHTKSVILILLCLVLTKSILQFLLGGLRLNYSVNIKNQFSYTFSCYLFDP